MRVSSIGGGREQDAQRGIGVRTNEEGQERARSQLAANLLDLERPWLFLARSYELSERNSLLSLKLDARVNRRKRS